MTPVSRTVLASVLPSGFPAAFAGPVGNLLGLSEVDRTYAALGGGEQPDSFLPRLLEFMEVRYKASEEDLKNIPRKGAVVVVANHPFGILEAAVLITALRQIRPDVRVLANELLQALPELRELVIPVDVAHGSPRSNFAGVREAVRFLRQDGLLIVFPAGAVSHFQWRERASVDPPWSEAVARLIGLAGKAAPAAVPVFIPGSNSASFHVAGMIHESLRTALLTRELLNKRNATVELRVGRAIPYATIAAMPSDADRIEYLRWRTYLMANRSAFKPNTRVFRKRGGTPREALIEPVPGDVLSAEIDALPESSLLDRSGDLCVYLSQAAPIPSVMREIGRLREASFRLAGEGTGRPLDIDSFDNHYLQLFLWHAGKQEIAGAYRLQPVENAAALYTRTLFQFDDRFLRAMGPAVELGRSFVREEYQRGFAPLLLLWRGIGKFIAANPRYKTLFGPVSISNDYQAVTRELMIAFLEKRASIPEWMGLVRARNTPRRGNPYVPCREVDDLSDAISDLEPAQTGLPVLLRQYLKLGGKLLSFNVDPEFSNALDGLIVVDLTKTQPKLLERYLGKAEARAFIDCQKELTHGT